MYLSDLWDLRSLTKRLYGQRIQPVCEAYGLTRMEMDILLFLANNPAFDTARDIVERKQFTKSHVSASVAELERRGYLRGEFREGKPKNGTPGPLSGGGTGGTRRTGGPEGGSYSHVHGIHGRGTDAHGADHKSDRLQYSHGALSRREKGCCTNFSSVLWRGSGPDWAPVLQA